MNSPTEIQSLMAFQRSTFWSHETRDLDFRERQLKAFLDSLDRFEAPLIQALKKDLGKSEFESITTEIGFVRSELVYTLKNFRSWAQPERLSGPLSLFYSSSKIHRTPYGQVLIIGPWNYPFMLLMAPLVGALAAGNVVVLKPSELAPATASVIDELVNSTFDRKHVAVVQGNSQVAQSLLSEKHDYIFFTGSPAVGKLVMKSAAEHLTPITLELGGKCPCIVEADADIGRAAQRIVWGKTVNAGQTCLAPDYLLVHESIKDRLIEAMKKQCHQFFGNDPKVSPDYGRIISEKHTKRLVAFLSQGKVIHGGDHVAQERYISPTFLIDVNPQSPVMQEEIFGPILPILTYQKLDEAIAFVNARPRPLAMYLFTRNTQLENEWIQRTSFGCGAINDTVVQLVPHNLPFGGVGDSGMGAYHGRRSFDTFSHETSVLTKSNPLDVPVRFPPYRGKFGEKISWVKWLQRWLD